MFSGEEDEKTDLELLKSAAFLRWVGFSGLQDESRQLVLLRARPKIISLLWFTLALGLMPASASIWLLGLSCRIKSAPDAAASASASPLAGSASPLSPGQRRSHRNLVFVCYVCRSNCASIVLLFFIVFLFFPPPLRML